MSRLPRSTVAALLALSLVTGSQAVAESLRIVFSGEEPHSQGLRAVSAPEVGHRVVQVAGQTAWATDRRAGGYAIAVQAAPDSAAPTPAPLRVTVTYLDQGHDQWALEYDAVVPGGRVWRRHGRVVAKQDSGQWQQATFDLPDTALGIAPHGWWLAVDSFGEMIGEDDEIVREISVEPGGLVLLPEAPVAAPGGRLPVRLVCWTPGAALSGEVSLRASAGSLPTSVALGAEGAQVTYIAPTRPGEVLLEAALGTLRTQQRLLIWPGEGPAQVESTLVDAALNLDGWMHWPVGAAVRLGTVAAETQAGGAGAFLDYAFTGEPWPGYVDLTRRTYLRGVPLDLNLEVQGEGRGTRLQAILEDVTGQRFTYDLGALRWPLWTPLQMSLEAPAPYSGGANDGVPHYPLSFLCLRLVQGPPASATSGRVCLRNVFVRTLAPAP